MAERLVAFLVEIPVTTKNRLKAYCALKGIRVKDGMNDIILEKMDKVDKENKRK